jgi:hypothetical protein
MGCCAAYAVALGIGSPVLVIDAQTLDWTSAMPVEHDGTEPDPLFLETYEQGSFSRAADRRGVAQPALTMICMGQ